MAPRLPRELLQELHGPQVPHSRRHASNVASQRRQARKESRTDRKQRHTQKTARPSIIQFSRPRQLARQHDNKSKVSSIARNNAAEIAEEVKLDTGAISRDRTDELADYSESEVAMSQDEHPEPGPSRAMQRQLDEDDARIAALERKLGRRGKKGGMGSLLGEIGALGGISDSENELEGVQTKRKHEPDDEDWLQSKRRRAANAEKAKSQRIEDDSDVFEGFDDSAVDEPEDDDEEHRKVGTMMKRRENPYLPPSSARYVPPSQRISLPKDTEGTPNQQLRHQLRGALNKLSESNMLDIVRGIERSFAQNSRNAASTTLIDLLMATLADRTVLNDTFIILHAGLITALYRILGVDFGARCVQAVVQRIDAEGIGAQKLEPGKVQLNMINLLSELYNFQVIGSKLIYDFIKLYILDLSERSTELLLKVVRASGSQLRQDDASSLNDVVVLLHDSIKQHGESTLSVRTKFMIDTINDLKNNRVRTGVQASSIRVEHALRVKKILASMNSSKTLSSKVVEPLRIGLEDIRNSESRGKWWLVGASFRDNAQLRQRDLSLNQHDEHKKSMSNSSTGTREPLDGKEQPVAPDAESIARSLGMNTEIRRTLFISIMTAASVDEAFARIMKLSLTKRQRPEVATVLSRCAAADSTYNPFYAVLAKRLSGQREIRKSLWNPLIECLARLKNQDEGDSDAEDIQEEWWSDPQARFNLAQLYGSLIAEQVVGLGVLKTRNLLGVNTAESSFLELLFIKVFSVVRKDEKKLGEILAGARSDEDLGFAKSLKIFIESVVQQTDLAQARDVATVQWGSTVSVGVLNDLSLSS